MQIVKDRDFLTALVLLFIGSLSLSVAGDDIMNWIFPRLATYLILIVAVILLARVLFSKFLMHVPDIIHLAKGDRIVVVDVLVFCVIVLAFMFVMYGLGFWLASLLMLSTASIYLTVEKTRRNIGLAMIVPLAACVAAYVIFLHVFYVPLPQASWWAGIG